MADFNYLGVALISIEAGATVTKGRMVKLSSGKVIHTTAIADNAIGVATESVSSGDQCPVQLFGKAKVTASAAVTIDDPLMCTASGAGKVSTAAGATAVVVGVALQAAGADGDVIEALLACPAVDRPPVA